MIASAIVLVYMYYIFYFSQLDKLEEYNQIDKVKMEDAKKYDYKLEFRVIKKIRTVIAFLFQCLLTIVSACIFFLGNKVSFGFLSCLTFLPIVMVLIITIAGALMKVTKSTHD